MTRPIQISRAEFKRLFGKALPAGVAKPKARAGPAGPSTLEREFDQKWKCAKGPPLEHEQLLVPGRKWRFDRCHRKARVIVELHGGVFTQGRHTRGAGFVSDRRKMAAVAEIGWLVYELCPDDITVAMCERIIGQIKKRTNQ